MFCDILVINYRQIFYFPKGILPGPHNFPRISVKMDTIDINILVFMDLKWKNFSPKNVKLTIMLRQNAAVLPKQTKPTWGLSYVLSWWAQRKSKLKTIFWLVNVQSAMNLLKWLEGADIIRSSTLSFPETDWE